MSPSRELVLAMPRAPVPFGDHVRAARVAQKRSMGDLARHLGLSVVAVSDAERGRATLIPETVAKIAAYLSLDAAWLEGLAKEARASWTPPRPVFGISCGPDEIREGDDGDEEP